MKSGGGDENAKTNRDENHDDKSSANTTTTTITTHNTVWFETKPMEVEHFKFLRGGKKRKISIPIQWNAPFGVIADIIKALVGSENNTVPLELVARYSQRDELSLSFRHALGDDLIKSVQEPFFQRSERGELHSDRFESSGHVDGRTSERKFVGKYDDNGYSY